MPSSSQNWSPHTAVRISSPQNTYNCSKMPVPSASPSCPTCALLSLQPKEPTRKRTARVEELLRGNHAPLDVELADFRLILEKSPEILQDLDQKIAQAKEMLDYLVTARHQAEDHMNDAKSLLHPMRSLPTEVMSEIFSLCVPRGYTDESCLDSLDPHLPPWTLSHVCHRWRSLALSSPQLWTYFELNFEEHQTLVTTRQSIYKMILFFERSNGLPLTLDIYHAEGIDTHPMFAVLETTIPRWKDLTLDHSASWSLQSFSGNIFPCLRTLALPPDLTAMLNTELTLFNRISMPALRVFEPYKVSFPWTLFGSVPLPWSQLTTIFYFPAFDSDGLRQLREAQSLEHLAVIVGAHYAPMDGVFSLPRLHRLLVTENEDAEVGRLKEFLSALDMPVLQDLTLKFESRQVLQFPISLDRATKTLTRLSINHVGCDAQNSENTNNLLQFLSHTGCVEELIIHAYALTIDFISGLTVSPSLSRLPCLGILDIGDCLSRDVFSQNTLEIYSMLQSRLDNDRDPPEASTNPRGADEEPRVCLERLCVPRWLFSQKDAQWKVICRALKVECALTR